MEKKKILIIDDEPSFTRMVKLNLEEDGPYIVRQENDSSKAAEAAREFHPDLIFLDVVMPGKDGGDVAAEIRANPKLKDCPIIFVTAIASRSEAKGNTFNSGGETFLAKPVSIHTLTRCIEQHLHKPMS